MEGEALSWFQWLHSNNQLLTWPFFLQALESRFAPSLYEDPKGAIFKLYQTSSVREYQTQFEALANRIMGLPPPFHLGCFISGLKPAIHREIQAFQSISLTQVIHLARLQEEKFLDHAPFPLKLFQPAPSTGSSSSSFKPTLTVTPVKANTPIKRLTLDELQARRAKGLCYNCDERFQLGYRCKRQVHLLIANPEAVVDLGSTLQTLEDADSATQPVPDDPIQDPDLA
jgi:hypothetical protein